MKTKTTDNNIKFLAGGGEMGKLTREKDWSNAVLGLPETWPQSLRTALSILLNSKFPMFLFWGTDLTCFYNDAFRPSLGQNGKHPAILGMRAEEGWAESWHIIDPLIQQVIQGGEAVWFEDMLVPIYRNGSIEDVYWTFSYSPVNDEKGEPVGVFVTCAETTEQIDIFHKLEESKAQLEFAIEATGLGTWDYNPLTNKFSANKRLKKWFGLPAYEQIKLQHAIDAIVDKDREKVTEAIEKVLQYASGGNYDIEFCIIHPVSKKETIVHAKGKVWFNDEKTAYRFTGTLEDITEQAKARKVIEESEQRFQAAIAAVKGILWTNNAIGEMKGEQSGWASLTGQSFDEYQEYGWAKAVHPDDAQPTVDAWNEAVKAQKTFNFEHRVKTRDGSWRDFSIRAIPLVNSDGTLREWVGVHTDITERKQFEKTLKENDEKLNLVIEASELGTYELNLKTDVVESSERFHRIFGYTDGEKLSHTAFLNHLHPDDVQIRNAAFNKALETGSLQYQSRIIWKDKSLHWIEVKGKIFYDHDHKPDMLIGTSRDITEEKAQQQVLEEREAKFRLLADSMPQHIWTADTEGNLNYYNQSVFDYSGLTQEQINKDGWLRIVHPDDREENIKSWIDSITTGNPFLFEHRFRKYSGEYRWQLSRAIPQKDKDGKIQMWVGTSTDIQEQKTFAYELERLVEERTKELAYKNAELEKLNKELQSFAYISSHDLQEPLRKIQTFATRILETENNNLSENGKDKFKRMQKAAERMQTLIDDLLTYSRTNITEYKLEKTSLDKIINEVKEDLKEELNEKKAVIETTGMCELEIIPFQFRQLMHNLIGNSLKFSDPGRPPHIKIKAAIESGFKLSGKNENLVSGKKYCHINISDNGIGFEQEYNEKIFEVFQRLHGKEAYNGTGIGLAIVKKIVENHQGIITASAVPGKGSTFDIFIPALL